MYLALSIWNYRLLVPIVALVGGVFGAVMFFRFEYAGRDATERRTGRCS
jgi:hypothetical protein